MSRPEARSSAVGARGTPSARSVHPRWLIGLAAACLALSPLRHATAARPVRHALDVRDPSGLLERCGASAALEREIEGRLRRSVFGPAPDVTLEVELTEDGEGWWGAHLVVRDETGRVSGDRHLRVEADGCAKALRSLGVVLAIVIGPPREVDEARAPEPVAAAAQPVAPAKPPPTPGDGRARPSPRSARAAPHRPRLVVTPAAGVVVGTGVLPHVAWGAEVGADLGLSSLAPWLSVRAALWPTRSTGTTPAGHVGRLSASVLGCAPLRPRPPRLGLCGGVEAGRISATAPDLAGARAFERALLTLPVELQASAPVLRLGSSALEVRGALQLAPVIIRDRFAYDDARGRPLTLHQPAVVALQLGLGLALRLPP